MSHRRTTSQLVATALEGAKLAGCDVVVADIHGGGFVRVYFKDPQEVGNLTSLDSQCNENDAIFEMGSA